MGVVGLAGKEFAKGRVKEMVVPFFSSESRVILPPCASTIPLTIYSPSPVPNEGLVCPITCANFENNLPCLSLAIPMPVSFTPILIISPLGRAKIVIDPPSGVNLRLFESRLLNTCEM